MQNAFSACLEELKPLLVSPPPPISDTHFDRLARQLFAAQFQFVAPYRILCQTRGVTPDSLSHWSAIPAVPASSFKEFDWTSLAPDERTRVFHSSGTTGTNPSRHFHGRNSLEVYERSILAGACPWLFPNGSARVQMLFLTPGSEAAPHSSLVHMFDVFQRQWGAGASRFVGHTDAAGNWRVNVDALTPALSCPTRQPIAILGTAFLFLDLLDQLSANHLRSTLPPGSWLLETGGYKGRSRTLPKPELHRLLADSLGVPLASIVSEYGMCELSSQAYDHSPGAPEPEREPGRCFRFPAWVRALIINPNANTPAAPGETGLLRIFDLANVRSIMAIQTEDLAREHDNGFVLLGRATAAESRGCSLLSP